MSDTRSFSFHVDNASSEDVGDVWAMPAVTECSREGDTLTVQFYSEMLMEFADDLGGLGHTDAEQAVYEENFDLLSD